MNTVVFGRDASVHIVLSDGTQEHGCIISWLPGGLLIDIDDPRSDDAEGSAWVLRTYYPYSSIRYLRARRHDYNA